MKTIPGVSYDVVVTLPVGHALGDHPRYLFVLRVLLYSIR